jgi:hypothetical protein
VSGRAAAGLVLALAGGVLLGLAVHAAGQATYRPGALLAELAAGAAVALVLWVGTLVLRREAP